MKRLWPAAESSSRPEDGWDPYSRLFISPCLSSDRDTRETDHPWMALDGGVKTIVSPFPLTSRLCLTIDRPPRQWHAYCGSSLTLLALFNRHTLSLDWDNGLSFSHDLSSRRLYCPSLFIMGNSAPDSLSHGWLVSTLRLACQGFCSVTFKIAVYLGARHPWHNSLIICVLLASVQCTCLTLIPCSHKSGTPTWRRTMPYLTVLFAKLCDLIVFIVRVR